jgi:acyl-homoserine lactone acylase PvdQ
MKRCLVLAALVSALVAAPAAAAPSPQPYQSLDGRGFFNILPPGEHGTDNAADAALFGALGTRPAHNNDQLGMYGDLVYASPGLQRQDLEKYFKDASFGVKPGDAERTYSPRDDVTIVRDKGFGIPHVYGNTRAGTMFGVGYAQAEDRLFLMDVFRRVGRGTSSSLIGGSGREFDHDVWGKAPYREDELNREFSLYPQRFGPEAQAVQDDIRAYLEGVNQYIAEAKTDPTKMPVEYAALGVPQGPDPFVPADTIAAGIVFGAILGTGGGEELKQALALQAARKRYGRKNGTKVFNDFREAEDPEAPTTVHGKRFPYQAIPKKPAKGSVAMPDPGSVKFIQPARGGPQTASTAQAAANPFAPLRGLDFAKGLSNAMMISARKSQSGHPVVVFGPQTGYFGPQPLAEMDIHGPGIDARGATVIGTPYVALGRGRDYAWSATSSGHDYIDTFALPLCEPNGAKPTINSMSYMYRGHCLPIDVIEKPLSWTQNLVDSTPSGSETLHAERTALGLGEARATIKGKPVIYTRLRATYGHEVDRPAMAVSAWDNPGRINGPRSFMRQAYRMTYTFNWFYADDQHIAYMQGGANPVRAKGVDPNFPVWGKKKFEWRNFNPDARTFKETKISQHPQAVDQSYITSWNNKPARGFRAADGNFSLGSLYRSQLFDDRVKNAIRGPRKINLTQAIDAMEDAGTVDLRGDKVLPWMLKAMGKPSDPALASAVAKLQAWHNDGSHRRDKNHDGVYEHSDAIRIMDAWWPLWVQADLERGLSKAVWDTFLPLFENGIDNDPNWAGIHRGSAYQGSVYGQVQKDLRRVVGAKKIRGRYSRIYCGGDQRATGRTRRSRLRLLRRCRRLLQTTLKQALAVDPKKLYEDPVCASQPTIGPPDPMRKPNDQLCFDAIMHQAASAIYVPLIPWVNRPTFQQALEIQSHAPR